MKKKGIRSGLKEKEESPVLCKSFDQLSDFFLTFTVLGKYVCARVCLRACVCVCVCASVFPSTDSLNRASYLKWFWSVSLRRKYNRVAMQ